MSWTVPVGFSWSATRGGVFADCPRAYFFQYYLAAGRTDGADPAEVTEAARLKSVQTIPIWVGARVHDAAEALLRAAAAGRDVDVEDAVRALHARMQRDYLQSVDNEAATTRDFKGCTRLREHEYGAVPERSDAAARAAFRTAEAALFGPRVEDAKRMLRALVRGGYVERVRRLGGERLRALENLEHWLLDGVKVFVKLDLAYEDEAGTVTILDWKTGQRERGANPLQMMNYALFATRAWNVPPARLDVREVYLRQADPERPCSIDEGTLAGAEVRIRESIDAMLARLDDPRQDRARRARFAPLPERRKCGSCMFLKLCAEGRETQ